MNKPVHINEKYILRVYAYNAILFDHCDNYNYQILNQIETDILKCVDGERNLSEIFNVLCKSYSIQEINEHEAEYSLLKNYVERFFESGVLMYGDDDVVD